MKQIWILKYFAQVFENNDTETISIGVSSKVENMENVTVCEKCRVPEFISQQLNWSDNGVILLGGSPKNRWVFYESINIDRLLNGLEKLLGVSLDDIIVESRRRETRRYMEKVYPPEVRALLQKKEVTHSKVDTAPGSERESINEMARSITSGVHNVARIYGYGDLRLGESWERGEGCPWRTTWVRSPYSVLLNMAESLGSCEAFEGVDLWVEYERIEEDTYIFHSFDQEHPVQLKDRLARRRYEFKPGDIVFERCTECGVPQDITRCAWNIEEGTIYDPVLGRRMAILGPDSIDSVLNDLESELGEAIPDLVIEAQRVQVKDEMGGEDWKRRAPEFRDIIALRGLGNLVEFAGDNSHLKLVIQNACIHLMMVGTIQALVELAMGWSSSYYEYEFAEDGDLTVVIKC